MKKKNKFRQRFSYWFDNQMSKGMRSLVKLLVIFTLSVGIIVALLLFFLKLTNEDTFGGVLWKSLYTVLRSSFPGFHDGNGLYLFLMTFSAICGMLVTSVLIGIVSTAIREKINNLRRGNSQVLEEGHTVVLGFYPGEYTLLKQLVLAAAEQPACIVIADSMSRDKMEEYIKANVKVPKNVRIICRTADIFDPATLEKCSISTCKSVIISPTSDERTTRALLAVSAIIENEPDCKANVGAIISREEYKFPQSIAERHNVTTLQTNDTLARIIAHSCTQPGLSETFKEVFNFEGSELYCIDLPDAAGMSFAEITYSLEGGVPIGYSRSGATFMNPSPDTVFQEGDKLLVFSEENDTSYLVETPDLPDVKLGKAEEIEENTGKVLILGYNETVSTILQELPENTNDVLIAGRCDKEAVRESVADRENMEISFFDGEYTKNATLYKLAKMASHIVVLSDHSIDEEAADTQSIFVLLNLRDFKVRCGLKYNITVEMRREHNQRLVVSDDNTDYVVSSNMSALFLAQLAASPELTGAFREILSNEGSEFYLKTAGTLQCEGEHSVAELRKIALAQGYLLLGYMKAGSFDCTFNPPLKEVIKLDEVDSLIVVGEK